jgi:ABC-type polysaccharide/polyol phosphate export permease
VTLAMLYVFVRDLDHLFEVGMRMLFFASPIIYTIDMLPPDLRPFALLNPVAHLIGFVRTIVMDGRTPRFDHLVPFLIVNAALGYVALVVFRRAEPALIERL